jgi:hypothetical protein
MGMVHTVNFIGAALVTSVSSLAEQLNKSTSTSFELVQREHHGRIPHWPTRTDTFWLIRENMLMSGGVKC